MLGDIFLFGLVVVLSAALPISVVAALGFRNSPFGRITKPIPVIIASYILADGSRLILERPPVAYYIFFSSLAAVAAVYAVVNAIFLLTERRKV